MVQSNTLLSIALQPLCIPIKDFCPVNNKQYSPRVALQTQWQTNQNSRRWWQSTPIIFISHILCPQPWQRVFCLGPETTSWDAPRLLMRKGRGIFTDTAWYLCLTCKPWEGRTCSLSSPTQGISMFNDILGALRLSRVRERSRCRLFSESGHFCLFPEILQTQFKFNTKPTLLPILIWSWRSPGLGVKEIL